MPPTPSTCPECGAPLPPNDPRALCIACLLKRGLETNTAGYTEQHPWTPPSIDQLAPRFPELEISRLIGRGGMGAVYQARQKNLDRQVALKILPPEIARDPAGGGFADRFTREAQALAKLNHPHIVTIHEFGQRPATDHGPLTTDSLFYFLMEYVDGLNLRSLLDSGHIAPKEALAIVPQICDALQYAHDHGIVHRDIKPENILLNQQGQVKIADFGLARLLAPGESPRAVPAPGPLATPAAEKVMGTPHYMAPEQSTSPESVDHRADIYSLGVVFYQMLTGELPRSGKFDAPSKHVQIDVRLDEIVLKALEREPERRYQQVSEVKTQVETIIRTRSVSEGQSPPPPQSQPPTPTNPPTPAPAQHWLTWSPSQSPKVRAICAHMTPDEIAHAIWRIAPFAFLLGLFPVAILIIIFSLSRLPSATSGGNLVAGILMIVSISVAGFSLLVKFRTKQREFLCSTAWAKQQGITPDHLDLDSPSFTARRPLLFALLISLPIPLGLMTYKLAMDAYVRHAGPAIPQAAARDAIDKELTLRSIRFKSLTFEPNTASPSDIIARFTGLEELRGIAGQNAWTPIDGLLLLRTLEGARWRVLGTDGLGAVQFYFEIPASAGIMPPPASTTLSPPTISPESTPAAADVFAHNFGGGSIVELVAVGSSVNRWWKPDGSATEWRPAGALIFPGEDTPAANQKAVYVAVKYMYQYPPSDPRFRVITGTFPTARVLAMEENSRERDIMLGIPAIFRLWVPATDATMTFGASVSEDNSVEFQNISLSPGVRTAVRKSSFGPTIELAPRILDITRSLDLDAFSECFINFRAGRVLTMPKDLIAQLQNDKPANPSDALINPEVLAWIKRYAQAFCLEANGGPRLTYGYPPIGPFLTAALDNSLWETLTPSQLLEKLNAVENAPPSDGSFNVNNIEMNAYWHFPATFAFRTRDGDNGILQILALAEAKTRLKIRYKLVQTSASTPPPATRLPAATQSIESLLVGQWESVKIENPEGGQKRVATWFREDHTCSSVIETDKGPTLDSHATWQVQGNYLRFAYDGESDHPSLAHFTLHQDTLVLEPGYGMIVTMRRLPNEPPGQENTIGTAKLLTKTYDIRDLLDRDASRYPPSEKTSEPAAPYTDQQMDEIASLVMRHVAPDSWKAAGGSTGAITTKNAQLIITTTPAIHQQIADFLGTLRPPPSTQPATSSSSSPTATLSPDAPSPPNAATFTWSSSS